MTITFVSNYINHHQRPFSDACYKKLGEGYQFIQTEPMEEERVAMGWGTEDSRLPYVHCFYEEEEKCRKRMLESDIVIFGWINREDLLDATEMVERRRAMGKLSLRLSERLYREGQWKAISPRGLLKKYRDHTRFRKEPVWLLCAGAYVASDFHIVRAYPEEEFQRLKERDGKVHIVWAGRFMPLKHPEFAVRIGEALNRKGMAFHIHMIGGGELEQDMKNQVKAKGLESRFTFYGYAKPENVRKVMEKCHIHLFTSNYLEGWGAVVNEAMNSGCAVVANDQAGAVPFLIKHGINGMVYHNGSYEEFAGMVEELVSDKERAGKLGRAAYETITNLWNAEHAAEELFRICGEWMRSGKLVPAPEGPLSEAEIMNI